MSSANKLDGGKGQQVHCAGCSYSADTLKGHTCEGSRKIAEAMRVFQARRLADKNRSWVCDVCKAVIPSTQQHACKVIAPDCRNPLYAQLQSATQAEVAKALAAERAKQESELTIKERIARDLEEINGA